VKPQLHRSLRSEWSREEDSARPANCKFPHPFAVPLHLNHLLQRDLESNSRSAYPPISSISLCGGPMVNQGGSHPSLTLNVPHDILVLPGHA